eukprot:102714_1
MLPIQKGNRKLIECQTCFRTFYTRGQFGQHARICRSDLSGSNSIQNSSGSNSSISKLVNIKQYTYKYSFLEKQSKNQLEIKSRLVINIFGNNNNSSKWKDIAKQNDLNDNKIKQLLKLHNLDCVNFTVRNRRESGLIIANFIIRSVKHTKPSIHSAKLLIEDAIDIVKSKLPLNMTMELHLCSIQNCKELVIRDTEGYCSRHRAQNYHKHTKKRTLDDNINDNKPQPKRLKLHHLLPTTFNNNKTFNQTFKHNSIGNLSKDILYNFFNNNCFIFQTPNNLINVSLNESQIRQNGMNLISINYSTQIPNTKQILKRNDYLITVGLKKDIKKYFNKYISTDLLSIDKIIINNKNSIRFQEFVTELIKYYIVYIPVPKHFNGKTLSQIRLYEYGINVISINLCVQHALKMSKYVFNTNDMLLCCFNRANDKYRQLYHAFNKIT